jgi:hypothetical protein
MPGLTTSPAFHTYTTVQALLLTLLFTALAMAFYGEKEIYVKATYPAQRLETKRELDR